jgi:hypothetical protein
MDGCTNQKLGRLLHDYELDLLSDEDRFQFELHLYECGHCLALVREFTDVSRILRDDPEAKAIIGNIASEEHRRRPFWITKLLVAAVIVMVLAVPTYLLWLQPEVPSVTQTLELLPVRTGGSDIVYLEKGGDVEISFFVPDSFEREADMIISSVTGDTIINIPGFSRINDKGLGSITLPVSNFSAGNYILAISPAHETGVEERIYMFRVK